ncbi:MAG: hypothetical protein SO314_04185 [Alphaproteobacteria bacterium]|nr:hypothetical protein [Alphaproteobacteria bacterium]
MFGEFINILPLAFVTLLFVLSAERLAKHGLKLKVRKTAVFSLCLVFSLVLVSGTAMADDGLFSELTAKGAEIFTGMRDIVYVVAGFGIIGVAVGGFFGNLNWKWLSAIIIGLVVLAVTGAFVKYVTGEEVQNITDTLK